MNNLFVLTALIQVWYGMLASGDLTYAPAKKVDAYPLSAGCENPYIMQGFIRVQPQHVVFFSRRLEGGEVLVRPYWRVAPET